MTRKHRDDVDHLFVVVRVNLPCDGEDVESLNASIKLVEAVPTIEEAKAAATRLGVVNANNGMVYFVQSVRNFPGGRRATPS